MRFCQQHWDDMRASVKSHGLDFLVAKNGEDLKNKLAQGGFDPLLNTHNAVMVQLLKIGGIGMAALDKCPLCLADEAHVEYCKVPNCTFTYSAWIEDAVKEQYDEAVKLGLVMRA